MEKNIIGEMQHLLIPDYMSAAGRKRMNCVIETWE